MLKGKGISEGIGIGKALVLKKEEIKIETQRINQKVDLTDHKEKIDHNS